MIIEITDEKLIDDFHCFRETRDYMRQGMKFENEEDYFEVHASLMNLDIGEYGIDDYVLRIFQHGGDHRTPDKDLAIFTRNGFDIFDKFVKPKIKQKIKDRNIKKLASLLE